MKQVNALELTLLTTAVAAVAAGCASSGGYALYDTNGNHPGAFIATPSPSVSGHAYRSDSSLYDPMATDRDRVAYSSAPMGTDHDASMRAYHNNNIAQVQASAAGAGAGAEVGTGVGPTAQAQVNTYPGPGAHVSAGVPGVGVSANAGVGTTTGDVNTHYDQNDHYLSSRAYEPSRASSSEEKAARATVSTLSMVPETRPEWVNKFPFYDRNLRVIETYTFAVPDRDLHGTVHADTDLPQFNVNLPPGSVFVESAGGTGETWTGRVIQHSPNPTR